jgi:hypothetical protein
VRTVFLDSFLRDLKKLRDAKARGRIADAIANVEQADFIEAIQQLDGGSGSRSLARR